MLRKKEVKNNDFFTKKFHNLNNNLYFCQLKKIFCNMKRIILTFAFLSLFAFEGNVFAQDRATDGFFKSNYELYREDNGDWGKMPLLPKTHGYNYDYDASQPTPLGSGLLLLGAMGVGYLALKKKD